VRRSKPQSNSEIGPGGEDKNTEIAAVRLLSRREHSTRELKRKLQGKGHAQETVERVVSHLSDQKLVCDERFAVTLVAHHARRGHGPMRIRAELRQQGTRDEAITSALTQADVDWAQIAAAVRLRKFGSRPPSSMAERAKQSRFLQYRGFTSDQIRAAMAPMAGDSAESALSDTDLDLDSNFD
jgi:regulatory protein